MFNKVFFGIYLKRLDNIIQWQDKDVVKSESVSQHSFKVSVFCTLLLDEIFGEECNDKIVNDFKLKCIKASIYHDWDEALLMRDISHETKYNSFNGEEIRNSLNHLSNELSKREFLVDGKIKTVFNSMGKQDEAVKIVVKFCDWAAMIFYLYREELLGNKTLIKQREHAVKSICDVYYDMRMKFNKYFSDTVVESMKWDGVLEFLKNIEENGKR